MPMRRVDAWVGTIVSYQGTLVGGTDAWADGSDATYISITDSTPPIGNNARGDLIPPPSPPPRMPESAVALARFRLLSGGIPNPRVIVPGKGITVDADPAYSPSVQGQWVKVRLQQGVVPSHWVNGFTVTLQLSSPFNYGAPCVVSEAALAFEWEGDAPPCRLYPREDGLGVGSSRRYPPPRSQQRSSRRFGYY